MSELSTNDEHAEELPDLREDKATSPSTRSGTVPTDESLDPTTTGNTSRLDLRTSPVRARHTLLMDIVEPSTSFPTRSDNLDATEQTSDCSVISDPRINAHDHQIKRSVCFPTQNDDSGPSSILNTSSLQQFPVSTSCNIAGELSSATPIGSSLGTSPNSPTVVQAQTTTIMTYRRQPSKTKSVQERRMRSIHTLQHLAPRISTTSTTHRPHEYFESRSVQEIRTSWEPVLRIQPSTSQAMNLIPQQTNATIKLRPLKCAGNMDPGRVHLDEICDTSTGQRLYECDSCGSQYTSEKSVEDHFREKHKDNNKSPECNVCSYIHTGEKPFKCESCLNERRFWHKNDLIWHYQVHFDSEPFKCCICDRGFWFRHLFEAHIPANKRRDFLNFEL